MKDFFVSYARDDHMFVELLKEKLDPDEFSLWVDSGDIKGGDEWRNKIDTALHNCIAILVVMSPDSAQSTYVTYEWATAMGKEKAILPLLFKECERHPKLSPIQYFDFTVQGKADWKDLIERMKWIKEHEADFLSEDALAGLRIETLAASAEHKTMAQKVMDYLNERGYRLVSFDRIREYTETDYDDDFMREVISSHSNMFRVGTLKPRGDEQTRRLGFKKI